MTYLKCLFVCFLRLEWQELFGSSTYYAIVRTREVFVVNYTLHNTMFLYHLYHRTAHKRILAKLAFVIDYGCSLGGAKMWSSGQGQVKTCWHLCHAALASQWTGLFKSLPLDDASQRKNVLNVPVSFCFQEFPSSCDLHIFVFWLCRSGSML